MKEVSIEYPETREIVGGEVHPRGTGARLAELEAEVARLKKLRGAPIVEAFRNGKSIREIEHEFGLSKNYAYQALRKAGVSVREARKK